MSWIADLAGKAESLLNNIDEQTAVAIRNHNVSRQKKREFTTLVPKKPVPSRTDRRRNPHPSLSSSPERNLTTKVGSGFINAKEQIKAKSPQCKNKLFTLNNPQKPMNPDVTPGMVLKQRRCSLPSDITKLKEAKMNPVDLQSLEAENSMLRSELSVINQEVSNLLEKLRRTEDGKVVVDSREELQKAHTILEMKENITNEAPTADKETIESQLTDLKVLIYELSNVEMHKYKEWNKSLEGEVGQLKQRNSQLEEKVQDFSSKVFATQSLHTKLENELRHANTVIAELEGNLDKAQDECKRLEKDWEAYKVRVKAMLNAKDKEIRSLQEGLNMNDDCKVMMEQLETLKEERDDLTDTIQHVRGECNSMRRFIDEIESKNSGMDRVVTALREALKDERLARNKVEVQFLSATKELKELKLESSRTIATLRASLHAKDNEINGLRATASSNATLNVADFDRQETVENEKVRYLSEILVHRQAKIDALLADNNIMKIQLGKLETKLKNAVTNQSVINFQDGDSHRPRSRTNVSSASGVSQFSLRIGVFIKRNPLFRIFIILYMLGLHFWVLTVLLTSTPDGFYAPKPNKA